MLNTLSRAALVGTLIMITGLVTPTVLNLEIPKVEASTKPVSNSEIEELKVEYNQQERNYAIHVGKRTGTLLIKVTRPKIKSDEEWLNYSLNASKGRYTVNVNMGLYFNKEDNTNFGDIIFDQEKNYNHAEKGRNPSNENKSEPFTWTGVQKFSGYEYPNYYVANATYIPKAFTEDGIYYFRGAAPFVVDGSQVKAYFYNNSYLVPEAIKNVKTGGIFPLLNKVYWGKTELTIGQIGKVTIQKQTTLWKRQEDDKLIKSRTLKPNEQFRVYTYINEEDELYGVGGGLFIKKDSVTVKYETPSKTNLRLIKIMKGE